MFSGAAAPENRVYAIGDGVRHTTESYARLLASLTAGGKVAVDDYVHEPGNNFALNLLLLFLAVGGGAIALFALARIAFGGAA